MPPVAGDLMAKLSSQDRQRITAVVTAAERRTSAEFALVIAEASDDYATYPGLWASIGALVGGGLSSALSPRLSGGGIFAIEAILFVALGLLLYIRPLRHRLVPSRVQRVHAGRLARLEFAALVHNRTAEETGILLFMSLAERHVEILTDQAIAAQIPDSAWQAIIDGLVADIRSGRMVEGLAAAVQACTTILEQRFPAKPGQRNEITDAVTEV